MASLEARIKRLEDLEAVRATWLDYCNTLDLFDYKKLAGDVFSSDARLEIDGLGEVDGTYTGRSEIEGFYNASGKGFTTGKPVAITGHLSTNMQINLSDNGNEATTLAYFFEIVDDSLVLIGTYQHRMVRQSDRWRIAFLRITVRYRARLEIKDKPVGKMLGKIVAKPVL